MCVCVCACSVKELVPGSIAWGSSLMFLVVARSRYFRASRPFLELGGFGTTVALYNQLVVPELVHFSAKLQFWG